MTLPPSLESLTESRISERVRMVLALARFREEWQNAVNGGSLLNVESPVGLLLADIADNLELSTQERHVVLGGRLISEVEAFLKTPVRRKVPL